MRLYFIAINEDIGNASDGFLEFHSSKVKAKKARTTWKKLFKDESYGGGAKASDVHSIEIYPTKKGIINALNVLTQYKIRE